MEPSPLGVNLPSIGRNAGPIHPRDEGGIVVYDWWLTPAVYAGVSVVLLEAQLRRAASSGGKLIFRASLSLKFMYGGAAGALSMLLFLKGAETEWWLNALAAGFVLCFLFGWPKTITTDERGIECYWWWRPKIVIPWDEVEYAETGKVKGIEIVGAHARITFEGYNADQARFCKEVTTRSSVKKIMNPTEFTGLHL